MLSKNCAHISANPLSACKLLAMTCQSNLFAFAKHNLGPLTAATKSKGKAFYCSLANMFMFLFLPFKLSSKSPPGYFSNFLKFRLGLLPFIDSHSHHKVLTTFLLIPGWFLLVFCPSIFGRCLVGESNRGPIVQESSVLTTIPARPLF